MYIVITLLKVVAFFYAFIFAAKNIGPAVKSNDRKALKKIGMRFLFVFLFILVMTAIEFIIVFNK